MRISPCVAMIAAVLSNGISACGLYVPDKGLLPESNREARAIYEEKLIRHINCEIKTAITHVYTTKNVPWIREWGTAITVLITTQDQSGINPTIALLSPMANAISVFPTGGNVVTPRSTTIGLGGAFSANATRSETIQFTYLNSDLIRETKPGETCEDLQGGLAIDGNLKIADFIYDKAFIADLGNAQVYGRFDGADQVRAKMAGTNSLRHHTSCALIYSAKATPDDEAIIKALGLNREDIQTAREDEDVYQFVCRGAIRDPGYSGDYAVYLYDHGQAERLRNRLIGAGYTVVSTEPVTEAGILDVVRPLHSRDKKLISATANETAAERDARLKAQDAKRKRDSRGALKEINIANGTYKGKGRPKGSSKPST